MINLFRPILISLSPNTSSRDVLLALRLILRPDKWLKGKAINELEDVFRSYFKTKYAVSFNAGRSALFVILKCLGVGDHSNEGGTYKSGPVDKDEVLLQAYTCVAVPNAVLWCGARPIYVDIDKETFNMDPEDLRKKISPRSKAIIVQHTFGQSAEMDEILKIADQNNLSVIEDCAHALGALYGGQKVGTLGEAAFFSFGRDKVISSVFGGMVITENRQLGEKIKSFNQSLTFPKRSFVFSQLLHPVAMAVILPLYNVLSIGKVILVALQKLKLLSFPVFMQEKRGGQPLLFPSKLPNALAALALSQFNRLDNFLIYKKTIVNFYKNNLDSLKLKLPTIKKGSEPAFLRYTVKSNDAAEIREYAKSRGILLGNWYGVVSPKDVDLEKVDYKKGSCPVAEKVATQSLNLPTHPRMSVTDAKRVVAIIKEYFET